jgi:hypothetical protein
MGLSSYGMGSVRPNHARGKAGPGSTVSARRGITVLGLLLLIIAVVIAAILLINYLRQ